MRAVALDAELVSGQGLPAHEVAQFEGEALEWRKACRLGVKVPQIESPAGRLLARMLAHQAIKPALQPARQPEIGRVDGQNERLVEHGAVEPVRHDQVDAVRGTVHVRALRPFVEPGEAVHAPLACLTQRRCHRR